MAIGEGRITPNEGEVLANLLVIQRNVIVTATLEQRIGRIEEAAELLSKVETTSKQMTKEESGPGQ
jgi:hypothetical protein